jgi:hypothetical protein
MRARDTATGSHSLDRSAAPEAPETGPVDTPVGLERGACPLPSESTKLAILRQDDQVDAWQPIDELIMQRRNIVAIKAIRETDACSLQQAIDLFAERAEFLRRTRPSEFADPPDSGPPGKVVR